MNVAQFGSNGLARIGWMFRSLESRNFRLFYLGQGISLIGTWMQMIAVGWLAYELTEGWPAGVRAIWLGVVAFAGRIPTFLFAPLAGVFVDRWNRRKLIVVTQILAMVQAALLAGLTLARVITLEQVIGLSLALGLINSLDVPARQSFMIEMVDDRAKLGNAIALNSSLVKQRPHCGAGRGGFFSKPWAPDFVSCLMP